MKWDLIHGDGLVEVPECDVLVADPPYSPRCHDAKDNEQRRDRTVLYNDATGRPASTKVGRPIPFANWSPSQAADAATLWHAKTKGWIVIITDHILFRVFEQVLEDLGRYVFPPIPCVVPGSRVRLAGDGPSNWTVYACVARPRHAPYSKWGTLPGAYIGKPEKKALVGGKELWLMRSIVRDYSRPGDLVLDPCCGAGTTGVACKGLGRDFIGMDISEEHLEIGRARLERQAQMDLLSG